MFSSQLVARLRVVVEEHGFPRRGAVAGTAIGDAFDGELGFVLVFVTRDAFKPHARILHRQYGGVFRTHMAFFARNSCVPVFQRKAGPVMREDELLPRFDAMACFTSVRHFLVELPFVYIFVACRTLQRFIPMKLPRTLGIHLVIGMAYCAGDGSVPAEQGKPCSLMIIRCKTHTKKIRFGMARFALSAVCAFGELSGMRIGMAIGTALKFCNMKSEFSARILPLLAILMTVLTFQYRVLAFQGEFGRFVIKFCFRNGMKIFRCVARCALLFEFSLVWIFVAGAARCKFHADVPDRLAVIECRFVAALAFDRRVLAGERVARIVMGKFRSRFPLLNGVADRALFAGKLSAMLIFMARTARLR